MKDKLSNVEGWTGMIIISLLALAFLSVVFGHNWGHSLAFTAIAYVLRTMLD